MWPYSSNMFLKKLINNLCIFPRSSSSSSITHNKNNPTSFSTHLSRHLYTHPLDNSQSDKNMKENLMIINNKFNTNTLDASTSKSTSPDDDDDHDEDVFFTSSSNHSDHHHLISDQNQQQKPDFATAFASQRFFFSSPGNSKSLINTTPPVPPPLQLENMKNNNSTDNPDLLQTAGGVPVQKYSPDPYWDFRKSMKEMMDARLKEEDDVDDQNWEYLNQLLTCYLTLNPINTHECIIKAFSDLLVNFLLNNNQIDMNRSDVISAKRGADHPRSVLRKVL